MKRMFATVALLAALGVLLKLAAHSPTSEPQTPPITSTGTTQATPADPASIDLVEKYRSQPESERVLVARVWDKYRQMAIMIDRTDGLRGLELLDRLDLEAIFLYEKHPSEFRQLRELLNDQAAAEILLRWREYFGLKRGDDTDRGTLIAEVAQLSASQKQLVSKFPNVLPIMLADPAGVMDLAEAFGENHADLTDAFAILSLVSLESGSADLRAAERILEQHGTLAIEGFRTLGLDGFALVGLFGPVFEELGTSVPLDQSLVLTRVNSAFLTEFLATHRPETAAHHLSRVFSAGPALVEAVGGHPDALRLAVEYGEEGERALLRSGPDAAEVVYSDFTEPGLQRRAVGSLGAHGVAALAILDKYATDPDFRSILMKHGPDVIPPIARSDAAPEVLAYLQAKKDRSFTESVANLVMFVSGEDGQATIRQIKSDGLERVASLSETELKYYQFLPMYDMLHLGNVLRKGHSPTSGEMTWALIDACFVVTDALSLAALQPQGAVASEAVRGEIKAAVREGAKVTGREAVESATTTAGKQLGKLEASSLRQAGELGTTAAQRMARWWAVRSAGGTYQVLRRVPEALPKLSLGQVVELARPLCAKAGIRLGSWTPVRLWKDGAEVISRIPPGPGLKYLTAQVVAAEVGFVGMKKMEEHLSSRRPAPRSYTE